MYVCVYVCVCVCVCICDTDSMYNKDVLIYLVISIGYRPLASV